MTKKRVLKIDRVFTLIAGVLFAILIVYGGFLAYDFIKPKLIDNGPTTKQFIAVGYSEKEADKLIKIKDVKLKKAIVDVSASSINLELATSKGMTSEKFVQAQELQNKFDDLSTKDLLAMLKNRGKEDKDNIFRQDQFYIDSNKDRYIEFKDQLDPLDFLNEEEMIRYVVGLVNSDGDKTAYENVLEADTSKGDLVLVNKYYKLSENYEPEDLMELDYSIGNGKVSEHIYPDLMNMIDDCLSSGYEGEEMSLFITSPYRSYGYQDELYNNYVYFNGQESADTFSARAGHSEHQLGLALDIIAYEGQDFDDFQNYSEFRWLASHCHEYGFILRYTEDNEAMTSYMSEPWHFRYVGKDVATHLNKLGISYDEYYNFYLK